MVHNRGHVPLLDLATELATKFVSPQFDDRVVRHTLDGAVKAIQGDRNLRGFAEQRRKFFLKFDGLPFHGETPGESTQPSRNPETNNVLPQIRLVPLLTIPARQQQTQKLACTLGARAASVSD
jgi:hypothetical protein